MIPEPGTGPRRSGGGLDQRCRSRTLDRGVLSGSHSVDLTGVGRGETVVYLDSPSPGESRRPALTPEHDSGCVGSAPRLLKFHAPEIVFGINSMAEAVHAALRLGAMRPMLVTDPGLIEVGWAGEMIAHLAEQGVTGCVWNDLTPTPRTTRSRPDTRNTRSTAAT